MSDEEMVAEDKAATLIPTNELWLYEPKANSDLKQALKWAEQHSPEESDPLAVIESLKSGKLILETLRLSLRELALSDCPVILQFANDVSINRNLSFGSISTELSTKKYITKAIAASNTEPRLSYKLAMTIKPSDVLSGSCWLDIEHPENSNASIGYFVDKKHWGNGYATEMLQRLVQFGFKELKLHRIYANCDAENSASSRVLEKVGMHQEGLLRQHQLRSDKWVDVYMYGILRSEWL